MRSFVAAVLVGLATAGCTVVTPQVAVGEAGCRGVPGDICTAVVAAIAASASLDVVGFSVRCTAGGCTPDSGSLEADVVWSDGTRTPHVLTWVHGFDAAPLRIAGRPIPTPPVPPTCTGVPDNECESEWSTALENLPSTKIDDVVMVLVQCSGICTATSGAGQTVIGLQDGTRLRASIWSYNHTP